MSSPRKPAQQIAPIRLASAQLNKPLAGSGSTHHHSELPRPATPHVVVACFLLFPTQRRDRGLLDTLDEIAAAVFAYLLDRDLNIVFADTTSIYWVVLGC